MNTTTRNLPGTASAGAAVMPPPARSTVAPRPNTVGTPPAPAVWQSSMSGASESTLRHLIYSAESDNFQGESSEGPRFR